MLKKTKLCTGLMVACGGVLLSAGQSAIAQTPATQSLERVEITGSNIKRTDTETASPVQVITNAEMVKSGYTSVSEVLQNITANGQGTLSQSFNQAFAAGGSGVSLRGLTVGATLVLIDGRRMAPYPLSDDGERPFVDISAIPFAAVERIEILKDGASAIYGSDAIAGVVNVILKKSFTGTAVSADLGTTQHGGGGTGRASIIHGFNGDNADLNGYVALEFRKQNEILLDQRSGDWTNLNWIPQGGIDLRPGARNPLVASPRLPTPYYQIPGSSTGSAANFAFAPGCTYVDMRASNCVYTNTWAQLQPKTENLNLIGRLNVALNADWRLSLTGSFFDSKAQQTRQPSTVPFGTFAGYTIIGPGIVPFVSGAIPTYTVPANYPGNTLGVAANIRALALGATPRIDDTESGAARFVAELNGSVAGWDVNGTAGYTRVRTTQTYRNYVDVVQLLSALNSPTDPFLLTGGNDVANLNRVAPTVSSTSSDELDFVGVHGSHELMQLQGGPLGLAVGLDYRKKKLYSPGAGVQALANNTYAIGNETNNSAYVELAAPVLKTLELSAAYRYDHYDTYGTSTTPKVGFKYAPVKELAVRGTASRGFRAPSATENGNAGALFSFNNIRDPQLCPVSNADGTPNLTAAANVPAFCNFQPAYLQGTSATLKPEKSKSYTLGLIFEPVRNWSNTLDYYKITINNQIIPAASLAGFDPLQFAVRTSPQAVIFGDGSTGTSAVGPIQFVNTPYVNGQTTTTSGLEAETRYKFNAAQYGGFTVGLQVTHMLKYDQTINGVTFKLAGTHGPSIIGGDTANPKDRAQLTLAWDYGPWNVTSTTNYIGRYDVTDPSVGANDCAAGITSNTAEFANGATPPSQYCTVGAFVTSNLSVQYKWGKSLTLRGTVLNLFDKKPPVDLNTYGGTGSNASSVGSGAPYNPSLHQAGAVGRFFSAGVDYMF
jgi:iron complex outermembrane recepter protein